MSIGALIFAMFAGTGIGAISLLWMDKWEKRLMGYYQKEDTACRELLVKAHTRLPGWGDSILSVCGPIIATLVSFVVWPWWWLKIVSAILLALLLYKLGRRIARFFYERRLKKIKEGLIDSLSLVANALRSGLSLLQSLEMVAQEMPGAVADEFNQVVSETRLGHTLEQCLVHFKERVPIKEIKLMVDSILILRETGGNLIETFEVLVHNLREEQRVQGKISAMTMQGLAQAVIITALPFALGGALYLITPAYLLPLFHHWMGWIIILVMLTLQSVGLYSMIKIIKIEI